MSTLDAAIAEMEDRVLNAATLDAARNFHYQLDVLRARRDRRLRPPAPRRRSSGKGRVVNPSRDRRFKANRAATPALSTEETL